jgi:hypothetical protein
MNIQLVCKLPESEEFVSSTGESPAHAQNKIVTMDTLPALAPKAVATWRVVVKALKADDAGFKVEVSSDQFEKPITKDEATPLH